MSFILHYEYIILYAILLFFFQYRKFEIDVRISLFSTLKREIFVFWNEWNKIKAVELNIDALYKNRGHRPRFSHF